MISLKHDTNDSNNNHVHFSSAMASSSSSSSTSSSSSSSEDDQDKAVITFVAPDGGWGWVVVAASFLVNLVADGVTFSFGVIFVELLKEFGRSKALTAGVVSLVHAVPLISGPVASALTDRFGCRRMTILGAFLASVGFLLSATASELVTLYLTFGLISGFGLSLCYVSAIVIVAIYFERRRSLATGISTCGSGVGTFLFAPLTQMLIDEFGGWRGAALGLALVLALMAVCGLCFKDLDAWVIRRKRHRKRKRKKRSANMPDIKILRNWLLENESPRSPLPHANTTIFKENVRIDLVRKTASLSVLPQASQDNKSENNEHSEYTDLERRFRMMKQRSEPGSRLMDRNRNRHRRHRPDDIEERFRTTTLSDAMNAANNLQLTSFSRHRPSLTYRGAVLNLHKYRLRASSCPDINALETKYESELEQKSTISNILKVLRSIGDCCILNKHILGAKFVLFCLSNFILYAWYDVMYVYLVDYAEQDLGVNSTDATMLLSLMGLTNTMGEILVGWLGDRKWVNVNVLYTICMIACGLATLLVPLCTRYGTVSLLAACYGLGISANYSLTSAILVELVSLDDFSHTYGFLLMVQGISNLVGPPFAGYLQDVSQQWLLTFGLAGLFIIVSGLLLLVLPFLGRLNRSLARRRHLSGDTSFSSCSQAEAELINGPRTAVVQTPNGRY